MNRFTQLILILFFLFFFYESGFTSCNEAIIETQFKETKKLCILTGEDIQNAINYAADAGGGIVYLPAGTYKVENPIYLKPSVSLIGKLNLTKIILQGNFAFTQKQEDIISGIYIKDLIFINGNDRKTKAVFYIVGGLQYSVFENLQFYNFENQTIFYIAPDFKGKPPRNVIFNTFRNIIVDTCNKCIVYSANPYSIVTENTWEKVILRNVNSKAIEAINWVDTEKWYNLYAKATNSSVILIDINSNNLEHAHGFHFYSPTLVYDLKLKDSSQKPIAIRLGKGTIRNIFIGVATDKNWDRFLIDDGADSYYILMDSIEDRSIARKEGKKSFIKIIQKGVIEK
ncbi:MAG: hypothetical protein NC925_03960 [Candidatus Omnitrophica bacterium]|nr:hypothetical protein [Candidatus Omnitrophota bacterium]